MTEVKTRVKESLARLHGHFGSISVLVFLSVCFEALVLVLRSKDTHEKTFLITVCSENSSLSGRYHTGLWYGRRWSCCRMSTRSAEGCDACTNWSTKSSNLMISTNITADRVQQQTNAEANNNPVVQTSQARSNIGK